jgi:hypothetical protein
MYTECLKNPNFLIPMYHGKNEKCVGIGFPSFDGLLSFLEVQRIAYLSPSSIFPCATIY